jgi:TolB-like protein
LVGRDEIREALWPDTQVDFDASLHFCVRQIRTALGDAASEPSYIDTLPRRGYRLIPDVERIVPKQAGGDEARGTPSRSGRGLIFGLLVVASLVAVATWAFRTDRRVERQPPMVRIAIMPFQPPDSMKGFDDWRPVAEWILEDLDHVAGKAVGLVGPTSTFAYGYDETDLRRLATDYDVHYIVNGRFLETETGPRVLAELIRASDGVHMWVRAYDNPAEGRQIGREISENVARELELGSERNRSTE